MKPNAFLNKPWYDRLSDAKNPMYALKHSRPTLESAVTTQDNNPSSSFLKGALRFALPTVAAVYILTQSSCGGQPQPPPSPERSTKAESQTKEEQTIVITDESTYKVIFPYRAPSSSLEKYVLEKTDEETYMKFVRMKEDVKWAKSLADLVNQSLSPKEWKAFFDMSRKVGKLTPYIPEGDIGKYQQSQSHYQGTRKVDSSGKPIIYEPSYFQQTATGALIQMENPDMGKQMFEELKRMFSTKKEIPSQKITPTPLPTPASNQYNIQRFETLLEEINNSRKDIRSKFSPYKLEKDPYETKEEYDRRFREAERLRENKLLEYSKEIEKKYNGIEVFVPVSKVKYNADKQEVEIDMTKFNTPTYSYYPAGGGAEQIDNLYDCLCGSLIKVSDHGTAYSKFPPFSLSRDIAKQYDIVDEKGDLILKFNFNLADLEIILSSVEWRVRSETLWKLIVKDSDAS